MEKNRFVRIVAEQPGGGRSKVGTGYWVRPGRVLTAAHVVEGAVSLRVETWGVEGRPAARVCWSGLDAALEAGRKGRSPGLDVALLEVAGDPEPGRRRAPFQGRLLDGGRRWESYGFANAARGSVELLWLRGTVEAPGAGETILQVRVEAPPAHPEPKEGWGGISGAPLFVDERIVGVLGQALEGFSGRRLLAARVADLVADESFLEKLGVGEEERRRRQELVDSVQGLLRGEDEAVGALLEAGGRYDAAGWRAAAEADPTRAELARVVCDTPVPVVLRALNAAHLAMSDRTSERSLGDEKRSKAAAAAEVVEQLCERVVPLLTVSWLNLDLPEIQGGLLSLPCTQDTVFELLASGIEGRVFRYLDLGSQYDLPAPEAKVPMPGFETGMDPTGKRRLWVLVHHLAHKFQGRNAHPAFSRPEPPEGKAFSEALADLNAELDWQAREADRPLRYYLILTDPKSELTAAERTTFETELQKNLPALWLFDSKGGDRKEEMELCRPLRDLLFRKNRRR